MSKKYVVALKAEEREKLLALIGTGTVRARTIMHARILLKTDDAGKTRISAERWMWALPRWNGFESDLYLNDWMLL